MAVPPVFVGAVKLIVAVVVPVEVAVPIVGESGVPAVAVAVKVTGEPVSPAEVAVNVFDPALAPKVHEPTVAIPEALVVVAAPVIEPLPLATAKVTLTPETGLL
jgi:hypothetical protein